MYKLLPNTALIIKITFYFQIVFHLATSMASAGSDRHILSLQSFQINNVHFIGNEKFTSETLNQLLKPYFNKNLRLSDLHKLQKKITSHYVEHGYVNSGAIIPEQDLINNTLKIEVVEGVLSKTVIVNEGRLNDSYIDERIRLHMSSGLNINTLKQNVYLLQKDERIAQVNSRLSPGKKLGESILNIKIKEENPFHLDFETNNYRSASVGEVQGIIKARHMNVSGRGDALVAEISLSEGADSQFLEYSLPVSARGNLIRLGYSKSKYEIIEEPFDVFNITNTTTGFFIGTSKFLVRNLDRLSQISITLEQRNNNSELLGQSTAFTPGLEDGQSMVRAVQISHLGRKFDRNNDLAFRYGVNFYEVTYNALNLQEKTNFNSEGEHPVKSQLQDTASDSDYALADKLSLKLYGQIQWVSRFGKWKFRLKTDVQITPDTLAASERFSLGGIHSIRGYRENAIARDNGVKSNFELYIPLLAQYQLYLVPFIDVGYSWNDKTETSLPKVLSSVGSGLDWSYKEKIHARIFYAKALQDIASNENVWQDQGIHAQLLWRVM